MSMYNLGIANGAKVGLELRLFVVLKCPMYKPSAPQSLGNVGADPGGP